MHHIKQWKRLNSYGTKGQMTLVMSLKAGRGSTCNIDNEPHIFTILFWTRMNNLLYWPNTKSEKVSKIIRLRRATEKALAGRMRLAGPALDEKCILVNSVSWRRNNPCKQRLQIKNTKINFSPKYSSTMYLCCVGPLLDRSYVSERGVSRVRSRALNHESVILRVACPCGCVLWLFDDLVISIGLWPARSPDLTPCDSYLWNSLKYRVDKSNPQTVDDFKSNVWEQIANIWVTKLQRVNKNVFILYNAICCEACGEKLQCRLWKGKVF